MRAPRSSKATKAPSGGDKYDEAKHRRGQGGKFADKPGEAKPPRKLVGEERLKTSGVTADDEIVVLSSRIRAYKGAKTVRDFVDAHPKGRAYALRKLAADHKKGGIGFKGATVAPAPSKPEPAVVPREKIAPPKPADPPAAATTRNRIEDAYLRLTGGKTSQAVRLSALRSELSDLDRKTVDAGLLRIAGGDKDGGGGATLSQFSDPRSLNAAERAAAFDPVGGSPFHIVWFNKKRSAK